MKCAYCFEEMNEGAKVCRSCGRRQPLPPEQKRGIVISVVGVSVLAAIVGYGFYLRHQQDLIDKCTEDSVTTWTLSHEKTTIADIKFLRELCEKEPG